MRGISSAVVLAAPDQMISRAFGASSQALLTPLVWYTMLCDSHDLWEFHRLETCGVNMSASWILGAFVAQQLWAGD